MEILSARRLNPLAEHYFPVLQPVFAPPPPFQYFHNLQNMLLPPPPPPFCYSPKKPLPVASDPAPSPGLSEEEIAASVDINRQVRLVKKKGLFLPPRLRKLAASHKVIRGGRERRIISNSTVREGEMKNIVSVWKPKQQDAWSTASDHITTPYPFGESTTLMIRNIPNRIRRSELLKLLDEHCGEVNEQVRGVDPTVDQLNQVDFLYLPVDFKRHANMGYAFVNFTSTEGAAGLYRAWNSLKWNKYGYGSSKVREITQAKIQGKDALKKHFSMSLFMCCTSEYLPVEVTPPFDGGVNNYSTVKLIPIGRQGKKLV